MRVVFILDAWRKRRRNAEKKALVEIQSTKI